jgi:hypothetical protein
MVLHTWTRELVFHPHVHAIVSAGALTEDDTWVKSRASYLFPVKVMARLFRRLFRHSLLKAIDAGDLNVPTELVEPMRRALLDKATTLGQFESNEQFNSRGQVAGTFSDAGDNFYFVTSLRRDRHPARWCPR